MLSCIWGELHFPVWSDLHIPFIKVQRTLNISPCIPLASSLVFKPPREEPHHALLPNYHLGGGFVPQLLVISLSDRLHHPHRVCDGVRDHAGSEPDTRTSADSWETDRAWTTPASPHCPSAAPSFSSSSPVPSATELPARAGLPPPPHIVLNTPYAFLSSSGPRSFAKIYFEIVCSLLPRPRAL